MLQPALARRSAMAYPIRPVPTQPRACLFPVSINVFHPLLRDELYSQARVPAQACNGANYTITQTLCERCLWLCASSLSLPGRPPDARILRGNAREPGMHIIG